MENWPNFLIVGAMRSGTSSLHQYLIQHKSIFMPKEVKEPAYFSRFPGSSPYDIKKPTKEEYLTLFNDVTDEKAIGEASVVYLRDPDSAKLIHDIIPDVKIIMILRDPVERAFSQYLGFLRMDPNFSISKAIRDDSENAKNDEFVVGTNRGSMGNPLIYGFYAKQLKRYLDLFDSNQIKVFIFEEFYNSPETSLNEILNFLNIDEPFTSLKIEKHNDHYTPRKNLISVMKNPIIKKLGYSFLSENTRINLYKKLRAKDSKKPEMISTDVEYLTNYYRDEVSELEKLLSKKLPWQSSAFKK